MPHRIADGRHRALRDAEEGEGRLRLGGVDDLLEVVDPARGRQLTGLPVAHAAAALVVADEAKVLSEELDPVSPHRTFPIVLEMSKPGSGFDERRPAARLGPGELHAV